MIFIVVKCVNILHSHYLAVYDAEKLVTLQISIVVYRQVWQNFRIV